MKVEPFKNKIWLSSPTMHGDELKYMTEAYETNWMSSVGENLNKIEEKIAKKIGCKYAVALSAGTAALHMAVKLAGIKLGDKVFCSDLTFAATVNPVKYEGAEAIYIDSEYETWNMDPVALEKAFALYPEVKVVILVHLYGVPSKIDEIKAICERHHAILVEDAAESLGATYKGKETGNFGEFNAISFNGNKIITGSAGGMLLTNSKEAADEAKKWSTQARENASWYQHEQIGYNYRMSNVVAGVVRGQLNYLDEHIQKKKEIYERYKEGLKELPIKMNPHEDISEPNYWLSCLIVDKEAMCTQQRMETTVSYEKEYGKSCPTEILEELQKHNAEGRPIWKPMHMQPINKGCVFISKNGLAKCGDECVDEDIFERGVCLPSDNKMTAEEQEKIIQIIKNCFEE